MITAIGNNVAESFASLENSKSGIGTLENIRSRHKAIIPVGEIKASNEELTAMAGLRPDQQSTRTALLGLIAVQEALRSSGISNIKEYRTGIISATSVGGMCMTEDLWYDYLDTKKSGPWSYMQTLLSTCSP